MTTRPWLRKLFGLDSPRQSLTWKGRRSRPRLEVLEDRLAPAVQLLYGGPGTILQLTENMSGSTPTVAISEPTPNLLTIDLGAGQHFDASSSATAAGLTYSSGTPAASRSATIDLGATDNVSTLQAALAGDTLVLGPITDAVGGLGNIAASAGVIRVTGVDTSHASAGNGNVDLKTTGDLTVASNPVLPHGTELFTGTGTISLAADVNADGTGNNGMGALTVQAGAVVASANPSSSAVTLRGASVHLDISANPAVVGARPVLGSTANPFVTGGLNEASGLAFDSSGNLYVTNFTTYTVSKVAAGSSTATPFVTTGLDRPEGLAFDATGNLYVASVGTASVNRVVAGSATATPFVTAGLSGPSGVVFDASGNLYVANQYTGVVSKVAAGTSTATPFITAGLSGPIGLAFDAGGNLYVANYSNSTVSKVPAGSTTATPFVTSGLSGPTALAFDASGNLYVANNSNGTIRKVAAALVPSAGGVVIRSSLPNRPMLLGDTSSPVAGINLSSAELARIHTTATGTITIGDDSQAGDITFRTARPATTTGTTLVVLQASDGPGRIVLDDRSAGPALDGNGGNVLLTAGAGGIVAANSASGLVEISTTAAVSLDSAGSAGTAAHPLHVRAATLSAQAASGLTLATQVSQLAANGGSGGVSVRNSGDLTIASLSSLSGVTAAGGNLDIQTTGALFVNANVSNSQPGNIILQAGGDLPVDPAVMIQASQGILTLNAGFDALSSVLTVHVASLLARAAFLNGGYGAGVTIRLVPDGNTPISLDGGNPGFLEIHDEDNTAPRTFTVTASTVSWGVATLNYARLGGLTITSGTGGTTFQVLATSAAAGLTFVGGGNDTLSGSTSIGANLFALSGSNAGTLSGGAFGSSVTFSGVGNLLGVNGGTTIQFADGASLTGNIAAGGNITLDYTAYTTSVVVDVVTMTATGVGGSVSGIDTVLGGSGTPAGSGVYNLLIGRFFNSLRGGTGRRNILVGGGGPSFLFGGDQEDLIIAGSTTYDSDPMLANWLSIAAYWAGTDDFATRAANLATGSGVPILDPTPGSGTVRGNGGPNFLTGNGGLALIFTDGRDSISGFDPGSLQVMITP